MVTIYTKNKYILAITALFVSILLVYSYGLMSLAPEYDEVLISNAALNCPSNVFVEDVIWLGGQCIPIMLSSYIGGFLAIPYKFFFLLVGPSVLNFRFFNIALLLISLLLIYEAIKNYLDRPTAFISLMLLGFDFQLFYNVRLERTMTIPFLLKAFFLYFISKYFIERKIWQIFFVGLIVGLSIWTKFDATFFYISIFAGYLLVNIKNISIAKLINSETLAFFLGGIIGILPLLYYLSHSLRRFLYIGGEIAGPSFFNVILTKLINLLFQLFSYDAINYIFRNGYQYSIFETTLAIIVLAFFIGSIIFALKTGKLRFLVYSLAIFYVLYFLYGGLKFSHHRTLIYPIPHVLLAYYIFNSKHKLVKLFPLIFVMIFSLSSYHFYSKIKNETPDVSFSDEIYQLADYVENLDGKILIGDWGITNQLLLLVDESFIKNINEIAFAANTNDIGGFSDELKNELGNCDFLILRKSNEAIFKKANENLRLDMVNSYQIYSDLVYEIYRCN